MVTFFQKRLPVLVAAGVLLILLLITCRQILHTTGGHFCYPLDDTFIHLSMAKNLALHGVWGINALEFSSASSSPLYTLLLATAIKLGFTNLWMPFLMNALFALGLLFAADALLRLFSLNTIARTIILLLVVCFTPLTVMIASGMEHLLHAWLVLLFLRVAIPVITMEGTNWKGVLLAGIFAGLAVMARFESLFLLAAVMGLLLYRRKWLAIPSIFILGILPLLFFGYLSVRQGGHWLPNSVLLKGSHLGGGMAQLKQSLQEIIVYKLTFGNNTMVNLFTNQYFPEGASSLSGTTLLRLLLVMPVLLLWIKPQPSQEKTYNLARYLAVAFLIGGVFHLALAAVGWLFRYEAYLVVLGLLAGGVLVSLQATAIKTRWRQRALLEKLVAVFAIAFTLAPIPLRAAGAYQNLPLACRNIYEQQYQMGTFLNEHYQHSTIAVNDIGAVSYLSNNYIFDLWGLGNNQVADGKMKGKYNADFLAQLSAAHRTQVAIVYDAWFDAALLGKWQKIATWQISNNVICGGDTVSFYAADAAAAAGLRANLQQYQSQLPGDVTVRYYP